MIYIRSTICFLLFIFVQWPVLTILTPLLILPNKYCDWITGFWATLLSYILKVTVGIKFEVKGREYISKSAMIYACKHQSTWETFIFSQILKNPCFVMKKELMWVPPFGLYSLRFHMIAVDRSGGMKSMKSLLAQTQRSLKLDLPVAIYPEGTRGAPGEHIPFKPGIFFLYNQCKVPVVPMALNSGCFWGKKKFLKYPGTITVEFLPPIAPGLSKKEFMNKLETTINSRSLELCQASCPDKISTKET